MNNLRPADVPYVCREHEGCLVFHNAISGCPVCNCGRLRLQCCKASREIDVRIALEGAKNPRAMNAIMERALSHKEKP
jgi:hypothetical protein